MAAPCVHLTSFAKISSSGFELMFASSDSSSALLVCLASVFCASGRTMILPLNTARDLSAEDALVDLVAAAVRHRVIDRGVVVDQLRAAADIQAVQRAVDAFAGERRHHVVADEAAAERERVRRERAAARAVQEHAGDVERVGRFFLQLVVVDDGIGAQPDFADRVRERGALADISLEHRRLRCFAGHDQQPRMRHRAARLPKQTRTSLQSAARRRPARERSARRRRAGTPC